MEFMGVSWVEALQVILASVLLAGLTSVGTALTISEFIPRSLRHFAQTFFRLLWMIPSVVFGFMVLNILGGFQSFAANTLALAAMILPTLLTLSIEAFQSVPQEIRDSLHGLGCTPEEVILHGVLKGAKRSIIQALFLSTGRAIGEAIIFTQVLETSPTVLVALVLFLVIGIWGFRKVQQRGAPRIQEVK